MFISISISIMQRTGRMSYSDMSQNASPLNQGLQFQDSMFSVWSLDNTGRLAALAGEIGRQAAMIGYVNAFYLMAVAGAVAVPLACLMRTGR
jgi:MFS transporter, DHA2 family, multidrug resistance protein